MIYQISGKLTLVASDFVVIETGGVGYKIYVSSNTLSKIKKKEKGNVSLFIYQAVRENSLDLYGFYNNEELSFFEKLIGVSGIGPKSSLGILSLAPVETLSKAIGSGNTSYLTKISGIGKKTAERIVLELKDKLGLQKGGFEKIFKDEADVLEALLSLGYKSSEAREALKKIPDEIVGTSNRVKGALKILGNGGEN
ncbi:Holliday junction DNA helicase RuvA [Candidatus Nomurabacteria bacterium RIFCSPLOWO2_01_FULL_33_24]|uniref:Holliday junction branch migration complex subunit RuvA n=1 Tax=Candidatus Nomurabacteria bacterium RIFCSPLOWO2_01_FULL_33_24 TaxID=1801765 RepID=A0A1F6X1P6_9BACT|nr:MAG: Holliday junction DNA helicase RuvA [Candidatus Nomurabacteria bacterium RIFCSPLOWO2_01_FULL_33_24]